MKLLNPNLEAFLAIVQRQTVHGAAKDLGITQTAVTQRIRSLEGSLSTTLFSRSRRGMMLTYEGKTLLRYCQIARDLEGEVLADLTGSGEKSTLPICITGPTSIMRSRIIPKSIDVMSQFKGLLLSFNITDVETWIDDLKTGCRTNCCGSS